MYAKAIAFDLKGQSQKIIHPAGPPRIDFFASSGFGHVGDAFHPTRGRSFIERVIDVVDRYKRSNG